MPTIHRLGRLKIQIYIGDHNPPHFHVMDGARTCIVEIGTWEVKAGAVDERKLKLIRTWARANAAFLRAKWAEFNEEG